MFMQRSNVFSVAVSIAVSIAVSNAGTYRFKYAGETRFLYAKNYGIGVSHSPVRKQASFIYDKKSATRHYFFRVHARRLSARCCLDNRFKSAKQDSNSLIGSAYPSV